MMPPNRQASEKLFNKKASPDASLSPKAFMAKKVADFNKLNTHTFHAAVGFASKVKSNIIDKTADIISAPSRISSSMRKSQADSDYKVLKQARAYKNSPNLNSDGSPTDAFKTRSVAMDVRKRLMKN